METLPFTQDHSAKNIPIPGKMEYMKQLVFSIEKLINRMRFAKSAFDRKHSADPKVRNDPPEHPDEQNIFHGRETYGFKTNKAANPDPDLQKFEEELLQLPKNLEFRRVTSTFQRNLNKEMEDLKKSDNIYMPADKSRNYYKVDKAEAKKLTRENVSKDYRIVDESAVDATNLKAKEVAKRLELDKMMQVFTPKEAYITLKDTKEDFKSKKSCRVINGAKTDIGKISKILIRRIIEEVLPHTGLNLWKSTPEVLGWFNNIKDNLSTIKTRKNTTKFVVFDIEKYYPSITEQLLQNAIKFAQKYCYINQSDIDIIMLARESFLYYNDKVHVKKAQPQFDVPMGCWDGAEISELCGLYLLYKLTRRDGTGPDGPFHVSEVGLYRDDGLAAIQGTNKERDKIKESIKHIFEEESLKVVTKVNLTVVQYLDIEMDIEKGLHRSFHKAKPIYINTGSNHPPHILKEIPNMIEKRISMLSSNEEIFKSSIGPFREALIKSGYQVQEGSINELKYKPTKKKRKRKSRPTIWFNPPFSLSVKTNLGARFLYLITKHFPKGHKLRSLFNRNTVKLSYSTTRNMASHYSNHNRKLLSKQENKIVEDCTCTKFECPLDKQCMEGPLVYQADVETRNITKTYYGLAGSTFKQRYYGHRNNLINRESCGTALSKYIWYLKDRNVTHTLSWSIKKRAHVYSAGAKYCDLCLTEKTIIMLADNNCLNIRSEILRLCPHIKRHTLAMVKP